MMVSSTPCCRRLELRALRLVGFILFVAALAAACPAADAQGVHIKSAELIATEGGYSLEANYEITLSHTLEEALLRGLVLPFVIEFELTYPRWWTLNLWNRVVSEFRQEHQLSFNALTRQYRVSFGSLHQNFDTLDEALIVIAHVRQRMAVPTENVGRDSVYLAALRLRLDTSQLPKPLQINALSSHDWTLSSDWYRWTFRP
jgi:hypothetical protein